MGRTNAEQRLKREIGEKNWHAALLRGRLAEIAKYKRLAGETRKRRKAKKYAKTAERLAAKYEDLRACVLKWGAELSKRIREELKFSEQEVADFQKRYEKEMEDYRKAHASAKFATDEFEILSHSWRHASADEHKRLAEFEAAAAKARSREQKELKEAVQVAKELDSEARDKAFFDLELKRIAAEQSAFNKINR